MYNKDKSADFRSLSLSPVRNNRQKPKLSRSSIHQQSLTLNEKRNKFVRQKRIYESIDDSMLRSRENNIQQKYNIPKIKGKI